MSNVNLYWCGWHWQVRAEYRAEQVHVYCREGDCHAPLFEDWRDRCAKAGTRMWCRVATDFCWCRAVASCCFLTVDALLLIVAGPHHWDPYPSFHFDADPDPTFHFDADPEADPASHQSDAILRRSIDPPCLHYDRPWSSLVRFLASQLLILYYPDPVSKIMRIQKRITTCYCLLMPCSCYLAVDALLLMLCFLCFSFNALLLMPFSGCLVHNVVHVITCDW